MGSGGMEIWSQSLQVPLLRSPNGLVHSHEEVVDLVSQTFFKKKPPQVETRFHDDPPRHPQRRLSQIDKNLTEPLI